MFSPTPWLLGTVAGIALQLQQAQLWPVGSYAALACVSLALLALAWRWRRGVLGLLLACCAAMGAGYAQVGWRAAAFDARAMASALEGRDLVVTGVVEGLPQRGQDAMSFRLRTEQAQLQGQAVVLPDLLALAWYTGHGWAHAALPVGVGSTPETQADRERALQHALHPPAQLLPGERWRLTVRLKAPHGQRNPHGFDHELRLWEQGVQAVGYVRTSARDLPPMRLQEARGQWIERARLATRQAIAKAVAEPALAGVIAALVMGDQSAIERADWDVFRATGVAHLMSISGLHITLFAWLAAMAIGALWRSSAHWTPSWCLLVPAHVAGAWGGLALAGAYAVFSGWAVPAQRTVCMLAVAVLLRSSAHRWPWPQVWLAAMAAVLLIDPWAMHQAGFWLSFVAVGMLFATDAGQQPERPVPARSMFAAAQRVGHALVRLLREQWVMTLALTPLTLVLFQQVSVVGLLANALAIPWVTLVVTPLALVGMLFPPAWSVSAFMLAGLMDFLGVLSQWSWAVLERPAAPWWCAAAGLLGGLLMVMRWPLAVRCLGLPLMLPVLLWQPARPPVGTFELLAFDIGQGSAVLVRTATQSLLYDAGPRYSRESDAGHRVLVPVLRALGERPGWLVLSHSDTDHTGGARALLASQPQMQVLSSLDPGHSLLRGQPSHVSCRAGQRWRWDGVDFEILHPSEHDAGRLRKPNALSCILRISGAAGLGSALLTGDIEAAQEAELVERGLPKTDWLMVPHHGSRTSSSPALLDAVQPSWAVVQAGYRNRFGHPAAQVLERYHARGIPVIETTRCGAATWRSDAPRQMQCLREHFPRYWHHRIGTVGMSERAASQGILRP